MSSFLPPSTLNYGGLAAPRPDLDLSPIEIPQEQSDVKVASDGTVVITHGDGSVTIGEENPEKQKDKSFSKNLAEDIPENELTEIAYDILDGIENDKQSRQDMVSAYEQGIDLLGLKMKEGSGALNKKGTSTVTHPILLESIIRFQSTSRAELLPAAGPVKVAVDVGSTEQLDELAQQLEEDFNHYLTTTATEYYPDTDRGLFRLGFSGTIFKKVYHCSLRLRPVSECVYLPDLIVSEDATDLANALRVTHQIMMSQSAVKRMQKEGIWLDIKLTEPTVTINPIKDKIKSIEGTRTGSYRTQDRQYTIYECYCELDLGEPGADGMPLPYRVTLEKDSWKILEIRRAWKENDKNYRRNLPFVMFGLIPGMGFLSYGYLHLLGNQTKSLTAIWRLLIDAGMFNNFPGGVKLKGSRQATNEINPAPGEFIEIDNGVATDIRQLLMPLPYKEPSSVFIQFAEMIANDVAKVSGATMMEVGEGRANVPVGTIMAMIEQQTQIMAAVHKRLHSSQAEEFRKLKELFAEDPEALWKNNPNPNRKWTTEEFTNLSINPASDPNIPAQIHRIMQANILKTLAANNPLYDQHAVEKHILKTIGISDPEAFFNKNPQNMPDPKILGQMADVKNKQQDQALKAQDQQRQAAQGIVEAHMRQQELMMEGAQRAADRQSHEKVALIHLAEEKMKAQEVAQKAMMSHELDKHKLILEQANAGQNQGETPRESA